jgi:hypothetical protein
VVEQIHIAASLNGSRPCAVTGATAVVFSCELPLPTLDLVYDEASSTCFQFFEAAAMQNIHSAKACSAGRSCSTLQESEAAAMRMQCCAGNHIHNGTAMICNYVHARLICRCRLAFNGRSHGG